MNPKYKLGEVYNVALKKEYKKTCRIFQMYNFKLENLTEAVAMIDTGYSKEETQRIIRKMYKNVDFAKKQLYLIFLKTEKGV